MRHFFTSLFLIAGVFLLAAPRAYAQVETVFPDFISGGGWSSDIFMDNQGATTATINISFFDDSGEPLTVESSLGTAATVSFDLAGGNTNVVRVNADGPLLVGYATVDFSAGASIRGSELFRYQQNGVYTTTVGVAQQFSGGAFSFPAEVNLAQGVNTGFAIAAPGSPAQTCIVSLVRSDGTLQGIATVNLSAGGHISEYVNDASLFPGLDNFTGVVSVFAPSDAAVVALRQDQAIFGSVSVDSGAVLAPFVVRSTPITEVEPNSSGATAQRVTVPAAVNGNISFAGDVDIFQFSGKQGDALTAFVSTVGLNSGLDAVLVLASSDGTILAENDENGLLDQSDSFLQVVLPADGSYYVVVEDYYGRGGANGLYQLFIQSATPFFSGS